MTRIGSLCSGYGGLEMGVQSVVGSTVAWHSDIDPGASKILAHHWPNVPNLGDMTTVDWSQVEPVDIITGGTPCQDLSHAGKRAGMRAGTRSGLWASMCDAIQIIRPSLVVWENVRGALSAEADSAMEPCPGCVGDGDDGPVLRALGRVLGDLAELGYDSRVHGLRAADVGAPHGRFRIFVAATDSANHRPESFGDRIARSLQACGSGAGDTGRNGSCASTPDTADLGHQRGRKSRDGWAGPADSGDAAADTVGGRCGRHDGLRDEELCAGDIAWGQYEPAIRRWQSFLGRCAPAPTEPGRTGNPRLSPRFVEWLMGLPAGHVTEVPGLSRNEQLKALGNGVVSQQCAAALRVLLNSEVVAA